MCIHNVTIGFMCVIFFLLLFFCQLAECCTVAFWDYFAHANCVRKNKSIWKKKFPVLWTKEEKDHPAC